MSDHYQEPGWFTQQVFNRAVRRLTRLGVSVMGSRELRVRGRSSGQWRSTPVNLLHVDGVDYLVSPRGVTQWVRNMRAAGGGELRIGRRTSAFTATEVTGVDTVPVLRAYLKRWAWEVGAFFDGVDAGSSDEQLVAVAADHPVFRLGAA
ncbi:MAG TPA: nitroreductase/quinone reductase family protein [Mycobacteriales bacterium]